MKRFSLPLGLILLVGLLCVGSTAGAQDDSVFVGGIGESGDLVGRWILSVPDQEPDEPAGFSSIGFISIGFGVRGTQDEWGGLSLGVASPPIANTVRIYTMIGVAGSIEDKTGGFAGDLFIAAQATNICDKLHVVANYGRVNNVMENGGDGFKYGLGLAVELSDKATFVCLYQLIERRESYDKFLHFGLGIDQLFTTIFGGGIK